MAFTKIQPQQVQLATFFSRSGHLTFSDLTTGVEVYINQYLTGDFNIDGTFVINDGVPITSNSTNVFTNSNVVIGGDSNNVSGSNNVIIGGDSNTDVSGDFNVLVNGYDFQSFGASGLRNTAIGGGPTARFDDQVTGAMILADKISAPFQSINQSLLVSFDSGVIFDSQNSGVQFDCSPVFETDSYFNDSIFLNGDFSQTGGDNAYFKTHLNVDPDHSGIFSGNVSIEGDLTVNGTTTIDVESLTGVSDISVVDLATNSLVVTGTSTQGNTRVSALTGAGAAAFSSTVTLGDGTAATSRKWITGGLDSSDEGWVKQTTPASPSHGQLGSIRVEVSGYFFDISGWWRDPNQV